LSERVGPNHEPDEAGDSGDADAWVLSTLPRAVAYAAGLLRDRASAEDLVHDCYCRLLRKADVYDLPRDGTRLLFRAITNACIDVSRGRGPVGSYDQWEDDAGRSVEFADRSAAEPWRQLEHRELQEAIGRGLDELPPAQRAAIELKSMGHSLQEIAGALGLTPSNVGVLIHRGRQALARRIGKLIGE
jgi:RNA polymerase sigma-70 factor (ECF subfamily)